MNNHATSLSEKLLSAACQMYATDIHFYPFTDDTKIYFRIHGKRMYYQSISPRQYDILLTYYKFTSGMDIGETRKPQNGMLPYHLQNEIFFPYVCLPYQLIKKKASQFEFYHKMK